MYARTYKAIKADKKMKVLFRCLIERANEDPLLDDGSIDELIAPDQGIYPNIEKWDNYITYGLDDDETEVPTHNRRTRRIDCDALYYNGGQIIWPDE